MSLDLPGNPTPEMLGQLHLALAYPTSVMSYVSPLQHISITKNYYVPVVADENLATE